MNEMGLARRSAAFLDYLDQLVAGLPEASLREVIERAGGPQRVAVVVVDVINGFCKSGSLASERVGQIVPPTARLLEAARDLGVTRVAVLRDSHHPEAPEFEQFAPHCQDRHGRGGAGGRAGRPQPRPHLRRLPQELDQRLARPRRRLGLGRRPGGGRGQHVRRLR